MDAIKLFFVLFISLLASAGMCQLNVVEWYQQADGLPNDLVKDLALDSMGFVWVATDDGLVKLEGRNFIKVSNPDLFSNNFKNVLLTKKYGIIANSDPGLLSVSENYTGIKAEYFQKIAGLSHWPSLLYPKSLFEALDSSIWFADLHKVYHVKSDTVLEYVFPEKNHTEHFSRTYQFFELDTSNLFVCSQKGFLYKFNKSENQFEAVSFRYEGLEIYCVEQFNSNTFFIGTQQGLIKLSFSAQGLLLASERINLNIAVSSIIRVDNQNFIIGSWQSGAYNLFIHGGKYELKILKGSENQIVNDIIFDKQNQLWIGTDMGLILYCNLVFGELFKDYSHGYVRDIKFDSNGNYVYAESKNVFYVNTRNEVKLFYRSEYGIITSLDIDNNGVWVGTANGFLIHKNFTEEVEVFDLSNEGTAINNMAFDNENKLWFIQLRPTGQMVLKLSENGNFENKTPIFKDGSEVQCIKSLSSGQLFLGVSSNNSYLFKYNFKSKQFNDISLPIQIIENRSMSVIDIALDTNNQIILGTSVGLWQFNKSEMNQIQLGDMTNEMVSAVAIDKYNNYWVANSNGILRWNNGGITVFNNTDGMPAKTTHYRCLKISKQEFLLAGTISGLGVSKIYDGEFKTPKPILSTVEKSGMKIDFSATPKFLKNSLLNLSFATPVYPAKYVQYEFKLIKNTDTAAWIPFNGFTDNIIFDKLDKGNYALRVRAKNKGNYSWSNPVEYKFKIYKTWYSRPEILGSIYLVVLLLIWLNVRYSKAKSEREKRKLELVIASRTADLKDQNEELKTLNANLKQAKDLAEDAINTKDRFFSILAHDLKSPFNTIIGFSRLLIDNRKDLSEADVEQYLNEMLKTSENTYKLLQNLLDWALSQTGSLKIDKKCFLVSEFINEVLATLEPTATQKNISFSRNIQSGLTVYADQHMLETIVRNLVANAIKYSHNNSEIQISSSLNEGHTHISVSDSGVGIPKDTISKLFSADTNLSTLGTNKEKGTGLGLVLCKEFVEKNNGQIYVESEPKSGTVFTVVLPFDFE